MISLNQVSVSFGSFELFSNISFLINKTDRIGLVGKNGAGKTTLLRILAGIQKPDTGNTAFPSDLKIGYLPQEMAVSDNTTVWNETLLAYSEILNLQNELEILNLEIQQRTDFDSPEYLKKVHDITEKTERLHLLGNHSINAEIETTLTGLGFERSDFSRPTSEFSGGWRMRIELAKILLQQPQALLLDEPTNHLDIEAIQWFEDFLKTYSGAVVLVSHDKAFLDNVTHRTIEISLGKIYDYKVSYSKFTELRRERREQQMSAWRNQQKLIETTEEFIERFRYKATKAVQVQSRIKQLNKIERIEIDDEDYSSIHFRFPPALRSGNVVVDIKNVSKSYGDKKVLENIDLIVERGEKICFVGRNGEGKTTLSRIIIGELNYEGMLRIGHNVNIAYYAQNQADLLNPEKTVFQTVDDIAVGEIRTRVRDLLGSFLFGGETIDKKVSVLSGGEKSRLCLACLLLQPANLLVLDEPTNHLDMRSKDILKQALRQFEGTVILVSHDRDFLDGLVEKVYEFRNKKVKENIGGIYDFIRKKRIASLAELERKIPNKQQKTTPPSVENKESYEVKKEKERELRRLQNAVKKSEDQIARLESEIALSDAMMANPDTFNTIPHEKFFADYRLLKSKLEKEMECWEQQLTELEKYIKDKEHY